MWKLNLISASLNENTTGRAAAVKVMLEVGYTTLYLLHDTKSD